MSNRRPSDINLHIERLVIDEALLAPGARPEHVHAALQAELSRLLAEGGLSASLSAGGAAPALPPGTMDAPDRRPAGAASPGVALGERIAHAVYGRVGP